jgi:hypothetical protein
MARKPEGPSLSRSEKGEEKLRHHLLQKLVLDHDYPPLGMMLRRENAAFRASADRTHTAFPPTRQ